MLMVKALYDLYLAKKSLHALSCIVPEDRTPSYPLDSILPVTDLANDLVDLTIVAAAQPSDDVER